MARQKRLAVAGKVGSTVFTAGYSGHTPESFAALLESAGVRQVFDVRSRPFSRKAGFSKRPLQEFLEARGLSYVHMPALGAPRELLDQKSDASSFADLAPIYRKHLAKQGAALKEAEGLARKQPSVLICLEKDAAECHRGILAQAFVKDGWDVVHL